MPTPIDYDQAQKLFTRNKGRLTRAQKQGPEAVLKACEAFVHDFDGAGLPWPDDWHRWNVAYGDAHVALGHGFGHHLDDVR